MPKDSHRSPEASRRDLLRWFAAGALTAAVPLVAGDATATWISLERSELRLPRWDADGFRVALITDLHLNHERAVGLAKRAIDMALAEQPDVLLFGGDFVEHSGRYSMGNVAGALEGLREAKCPYYAVLGNHDYWSEAPAEVIAAIRGAGVPVLRNEAVEVEGVTIAGIDDAIVHRERPEFLVPGAHSRSLLALFHEPDFVEALPTHVSLQLSGHSHGGQVCFPGGRPFMLPTGAKRYIAGFYPEARVPLYVSRGVGTTGPSIRLFCRPEVTVLTLREG